jgi:hypothetical protein
MASSRQITISSKSIGNQFGDFRQSTDKLIILWRVANPCWMRFAD